MQGYIDIKPLEFVDFSGGLTDNFLQGGIKRYAKADNFLITVDHKLEVRPGTTVYDSVAYQLGTNTTRVSGLFTGISESLLFAHTNRDLYTQLPNSSSGNAFTRITGPTGNEAISGGTSYNQLTHGEFQRQLYYTTDCGTQPGKIFRDQTNAWKAVTAGLPKMQWTPNYPTDASLIAGCITLANALRASMVAHFNDSSQLGGTSVSNTFQHKLIDKWSLSYFVAQTWSIADIENPGPVPTPTPAPNASDAASLYALCLALGLAYEHHRNDLAGQSPLAGVGAKVYHQNTNYQPALLAPNADGNIGGYGIAIQMVLSGLVTSPAKAAAFLDELAQKWYWHQLTPYAHSPNNDYAQMSRYLITASKVGTIYSNTTTMQVTPNYIDFISFAYWIKRAFNRHVSGQDSSGGAMHTQVDVYSAITLPDPTDFDSAALVIYWARFLYGLIHLQDTNNLDGTHTRITYTSSTNSPNITAVTQTSTASAITLTVGSWVMATSGLFYDINNNIRNQKAARVLASASGTATLSKPVLVGATGNVGQLTPAWVHAYYVTQAFPTTADNTFLAFPTAAELLANYGTVGTNLSTWVALGAEFINCFGAHLNNGSVHYQTDFLGNELQGTSAPNGNQFFVPTVVTYAYASFYRYQYTVEQNGLLYLNQGSPVFSNSILTTPGYPAGTVIPAYNTTYVNSATISVENKTVNITGIPSLVNNSLTNYDTTVSVAPQPTDPTLTAYSQNLTIELYRTTNGGTTFYSLDQLANSTTILTQSYGDSINENFPRSGATALNLGKVMYTSGGVQANDQPPPSKYIHSVNGFVYYGAITDTGQFFPQRIRQSIQGAPDSCPATFFDDLDDEVTGISSTRSNLIGFCRNSVYRMSGSFTSTGQGSITHEKISEAMGCLNAKSIVKTEIGVFFAGSDGFYYTDGYQLIKISLDLDASYRACTTSDTQKARIYGAYDKLTRRIWWAMQSQETGQDNDVFFVYYLDYGVKPSGVFTKALTTASWNPASAVFYKGNLVIGDSRGYLFKTDKNVKTDPKINTSTAPSTWTTTYIPWEFRTCALDFGTTFKRKWVTRIHLIGQNVGNNSIQVITVNDNNDTTQGPGILNLPPIQYQGNAYWGDPRVVWGTAGYAWKYDGKMDVWRRFPARSMRSDFRQIALTPGNFVNYRSDDYPAFCFASVSSIAKTATISTPAGSTSILWPLDVVDMSIAFSTDNYATKYLITALDNTSKIITFTDASNTVITNATAKWQISGMKKEQRLRITAFDIHFGMLGDESMGYVSDTSNTGAGVNA